MTDEHSTTIGQTDHATRIADLMVESDRNLDRVYKRAVVCTGLITLGVVVLVADLLFFSLGSKTGQVIYYTCLGLLLAILVAFLYFYFIYTRKDADLKERIKEARHHLMDTEKIEEFRNKIRQRIERMRSELAWFKQLESPGAFDTMDTDRNEERGNEEFEYFVRKYFEKMGFRLERSSVVTETGIYMLMTKEKRKYLVYPVHPPGEVDIEMLREANRELLSRSIDSALVVTAGSFTEKAREYADQRNILLYDRPALQNGIGGITSILKSRIREEEELLSSDNPLEYIQSAEAEEQYASGS
ncbi:MAG: restriction endonuclease [Planctomycetota bacterium]|nr:restriction endonuclease [Planctomycetota bacterium]